MHRAPDYNGILDYQANRPTDQVQDQDQDLVRQFVRPKSNDERIVNCDPTSGTYFGGPNESHFSFNKYYTKLFIFHFPLRFVRLYASTWDRKRISSRMTPPRTICDTGSAVVQMNSVSGCRTRRKVPNSWKMFSLYSVIPSTPYLHTVKRPCSKLGSDRA